MNDLPHKGREKGWYGHILGMKMKVPKFISSTSKTWTLSGFGKVQAWKSETKLDHTEFKIKILRSEEMNASAMLRMNRLNKRLNGRYQSVFPKRHILAAQG